jgi:L-lactate dehydrogenase complex protein LldG
MSKPHTADAHELPDAAVIETFTESLDRLGVTWQRVEATEVADAVARAVDPPAAGVPLSIDGTALPDAVVSTVQSHEAIERAATGVTEAVLGVAEYGSIVLRRDALTEPLSLFVERHVAVLRASDVVADMPTAFGVMGEALAAEPTSFVVATGPSATADMGRLVRGAHGPREVWVIIVSDR